MAQASTGRAPATISFATDGPWSVRELRDTLDTLEAMYGVFLVFESLPPVQDAGFMELVVPSFELAEATAFLTLGWQSRWLSDPGLLGHVQWRMITDARPRFLDLLRAGVYKRAPSGALVVKRIQIASPGGISLQGLGEPIRELRELIKDFWYRNRQERAMGDIALEAARTRLEQLKAAPYRNTDGTDNATLLLADGLLQLATQDAARMLLLPGEPEG